MTFANPAALWLLALALPVLALHVLRPRRLPHVVSSTLLWERAATPVSAATPWQRLRPSLLLLLQLLVVAGLAVAAAQPARTTEVPLAPHTVFVLDASGSMLATDGDPDRLDEAKSRAEELRGQLPPGGLASLVVAGTTPDVVLTASDDPQAFRDALAPVRASAGAADLAGALALAASLETPDVPVGFVLLTDGGLGPEALAAVPAGTRDERVGRDATNRALWDLTVEDRGSAVRARVTVAGTGGPEATQVVRFDVDGETRAREEVRVAAGDEEVLDVDLPPGERVEVLLEGTDLLAADDRAVAVVPRRRDVRVLLAGPTDPFLEEALATSPNVTVEVVDEALPAAGFDLAVYHRVPVPEDPGAPVLAVATPAVPGALGTDGVVEGPVPSLVRTDDPLLADLDLSGVAVAEALRADVVDGEVLVGAEGAPLLVRGATGGRPYAWLAFSPADSTLALDVAYPVLVDRLVAELSGAAPVGTGLEVGDLLPVDTELAATVVDPRGAEVPVAPGRVAPAADLPGFWSVRVEGRPEVTVAVNPAPEESDIQPAPPLPVEDPPDVVAGETSPGQVPMLAWVVPIVLALLAAEALVARRRVGVPLRQWHLALALRVAVAAALVVALLAPDLHRRSGDVATVFLVDVSDSVGPGGRADGVAFVRDALADQPGGARAGVVLFGGDARIERAVARDLTLATPGVVVDASATDLAGALRLGGAILPSDARRRLVLVSDGRPTRGDEAAEVDRLVEDGVVVESHLVGAGGVGGDVAVVGVQGPGSALEGDEVVLEAVVDASSAGPATLVLDRDGDEVERRQVDLPAGPSTHELAVVADEQGVLRYRVRVEAPGDPSAQNDVGFAAVQVRGAASVIVAEGAPGDAEPLVAALRAGGMDVEVTLARQLPALDELTQHTSVVLVDVDRNELSSEQVATLGAATRDLGMGLVTVGGLHSYALGGYRESDLEALLPVESEIHDPQRRRSVAQVLAIDTSGSMSACHCADGGNGLAGGGNRGPAGGVSKTDIARSAAARAIDALAPNDEVGLLAVDDEDRWIIDLQQVPADDVIDDGLGELAPVGETDLATTLATAAEELRASRASLKHIILFTDGFTQPGVLEGLGGDARALFEDEGITVSVLGTGEGSAEQLEDIAEAGGGRFYPGRDLSEIPQIMQQEVVLASRDFIQEGEELPVVSAPSPVTATLEASPPLLGYLATTAKPTATQVLRIGDELDPLLASWRVGLGKVTSWTSDSGVRWGQPWVGWEGTPGFWSAVVRDTFPAADGNGAVRARVDGGTLRLRVEAEQAFADGTTAVARVTGPDLEGAEVELRRVDATAYEGEVPADRAGTYAVGAEVREPDGSTQVTSTLASQGYSPEYLPGEPDEALLASLSATTGGRGLIDPDQAFDAAGLDPGRQRLPVVAWLLVAAALAWPLAVAASRLARKGWLAPALVDAPAAALGWVRQRLPPGPTASRPVVTGRRRGGETPSAEGPGGPLPDAAGSQAPPASGPGGAAASSGRAGVAGSVTGAPGTAAAGGADRRSRREARKARRRYVDSETEARRTAESAPPPTLDHLLKRKRGQSDDSDSDGSR